MFGLNKAKMQNLYACCVAVVVSAFALVACTPLHAASYVYSQGRKTIKVCTLLLPTVDNTRAQGGYSPAEWNAGMFAVLDQRTDIKPAGWDLVNPLAPTLITARIAARYGLSSLNTPPRVTKDQAWYWDVKLDEVTLSRLLQFDLVYLPIPSGVSVQLNPEQRDVLRKLVDSGTQLWIDYGGGSGGAFSNAACGVDSVFFGAYDFAAGGARQPGNPVSRHHPILSYPFWLNQNEINRLGSPTVSSVITGGGSALAAVVTAGNGAPYIAAGQYGSGHVIMTSTNIGQDIARGVFGNNASLAAPEDLKLAYNIIAWGSNYTTTFRDASHSSSASEGPGAPLVKRWEYAASGGVPGNSAIVYKGVVFYTDVKGTVHAFDGVPQQDLDNDGSPDDGIRDYSMGAPFDQIWEIEVPDGRSGPTMIVWPGGAPYPAGTDVLLVAGGDGIYSIAPFQMPLGSATAVKLFDVPSPAPVAPTYHNGIVYAVGTSTGTGSLAAGTLYCYDVSIGQQWAQPDVAGANFGLGARPVAPTVGWVRDAGSNALDLVAYWDTQTVGLTGVTPNDRLLAALMSVRNEPLKRLGASVVATRYSNAWNVAQPGGAPQWKLWALDATNCLDLTSHLSTATPAPGQWQLDLTGLPAWMTAVTPVFADYRIARDDSEIPSGAPRGAQNFRPRTFYSPKPEPTAAAASGITYPTWETNNTVAMGPDGILYMVGTRGNASMVYALAESGPRFNQLAGEAAYPAVSLNCSTYLDKVDDTLSGITYFPAFDYTLDTTNNGSGIALASFQAVGPPAVTNDAVYVTATAATSDGGSAVVLLAFERSHKFQIKIAPDVNLYDTDGRPLPVRVWQPNPYGTSGGAQPLPIQEAARVYGNNIDYGRRVITIDNFDPPSNALLINNRPLLAGLPVHVFVGDVEVSADSTAFSNLKWYYVAYMPEVPPVANCTLGPGSRDASRAVSPPTVLGEYVYFGTASGHIYAVKTNATPSRGKQVFGVDTNYHRQWECAGSTGLNPGGQASTDVVWQEAVSRSGLVRPLAGAGGLLAAVSDTGIAVFDSPGTLIVDNNRILEVDAGAKIVWSIDGTYDQKTHGMDFVTAPTGLSVKKTPFARPSVARFTDQNNLLICDTGNNRIVQCDRAGQTLLRIRDFEDPRNLLPSGAPKSLNGPVDVRMWQGVEPDPALEINPPMAYVYHYLVADRNNYRILDLVVRYDANGNPLPSPGTPALTPDQDPPVILNWVSASGSYGRKLMYESAQVFPRDNQGNMDVLALVSNYTTNAQYDPNTGVTDPAPAQGEGGAIVELDYGQVSGPAGSVKWTYHQPGKIIGEIRAINDNGAQRKLVNPRFFERTFSRNGSRDIICDRAGVWELDTSAAANGIAPVLWSYPGEAYRTVRGVPLLASSAKVLPNGNCLISNEYTGLGASGNDFHGEVFEVQRLDASGQPQVPAPIVWSAPAVKPDAFGQPQQVIEGSYILEQPTFADRR
ncbi:MAG: hypothetical protein IT209_04555 [Armatimonadetes bacterium]|nr:hypothetical protein [Armatimonadota bacterium]